MSSHWVMGVMAVAHAQPQPSGIPYLTIFGIVGTLVGIAAAVQQFTSSIRRRRFQNAEDRLLLAVESSEVISASLSQVEQYKRVKDSLRNEIETQIPKQARIAYLSNRLAQLKDDLYRTYREYESVRKELSRDQETSELDRSIRDAVSASMPPHRMQESRNLYMLSLVIILLLSNVIPYGPDYYFRAVGDSTNFTVANLIIVMISGALCLVLLWLLLLSFVSNSNSLLLRFQRLHRLPKMALAACPVLVAVLAAILGFILWDRAGYEQYVQYQFPVGLLNYAEAAFNTSVVALSIGIAVPISLWQRRVWHGGGGFRQRK